MGDTTVESLLEQMRDLSFGTSGNLKAARALIKKCPRDSRKKMAELATEEGGYIQKAFGDVFHYNENARRYVDRDRRKICMENKVMMANAFGGVKSMGRESGKSGKVQRSRSRSNGRKDDSEEARFGSRRRDEHSGKHDRHSSKQDRHSSKHDRHNSRRHHQAHRHSSKDPGESLQYGKHERSRSSSGKHRHGHRRSEKHSHGHSRSRHREQSSRSGERERNDSRHEKEHRSSRHSKHSRNRSSKRDRKHS